MMPNHHNYIYIYISFIHSNVLCNMAMNKWYTYPLKLDVGYMLSYLVNDTFRNLFIISPVLAFRVTDINNSISFVGEREKVCPIQSSWMIYKITEMFFFVLKLQRVPRSFKMIYEIIEMFCFSVLKWQRVPRSFKTSQCSDTQVLYDVLPLFSVYLIRRVCGMLFGMGHQLLYCVISISPPHIQASIVVLFTMKFLILDAPNPKI